MGVEMRYIAFSMLVCSILIGIGSATTLGIGAHEVLNFSVVNGNIIILSNTTQIARFNYSDLVNSTNSRVVFNVESLQSANDIGIVNLQPGQSYQINGNTTADFEALALPFTNYTFPTGTCGELQSYSDGGIYLRKVNLPCLSIYKNISLSFGENVSLSNSTYGLNFSVYSVKPFNKIINLTAPFSESFAGNLTINANIPKGNKIIPLNPNESITNSTFNTTYSCKYPIINQTITLPLGQNVSYPALKLKIIAPNYTAIAFNWTNLTQIYNNRILPHECSANDIESINGNPYCIANDAPNVSVGVICTEQQLLDHNLFEGLNGCFVNFSKAADYKNQINFSNYHLWENSSNEWQRNDTADRLSIKNGNQEALIIVSGFLGAAAIIIFGWAIATNQRKKG